MQSRRKMQPYIWNTIGTCAITAVVNNNNDNNNNGIAHPCVVSMRPFEHPGTANFLFIAFIRSNSPPEWIILSHLCLRSFIYASNWATWFVAGAKKRETISWLLFHFSTHTAATSTPTGWPKECSHFHCIKSIHPILWSATDWINKVRCRNVDRFSGTIHFLRNTFLARPKCTFI